MSPAPTSPDPADRPAAEWDSANGRFLVPLRCPHPGCDHPADPAPDGATDWCPACERPFAHRLIPGVGPDLPTTRRAATAFCPLTGQILPDPSPLCWAGAGGGPGQTHAQADPAGRVFGAPDRRRAVRAALAWQSPAWESGVDEPVIALSVHRGTVVATGPSGRLGLLDPVDGASQARSISWPDNQTQRDHDARVVHPPAFCAGIAAVATRYQLCLRPLRRPDAAHLLRPAPGAAFYGPPVALALRSSPDSPPDTPAFAILEGRDTEAGWRGSPRVRVFLSDGTPAAEAEAPDLARPPILLPAARSHDPARLLWIDLFGALTLWEPGQPPRRAEPATFLHLPTNLRPTFAAAPDDHGSVEIWVAWGHQEQADLRLARAPLAPLLAPRRPAGPPPPPFQWDTRQYPIQGVPTALAVGRGSPGGRNPAGDLLAIALEGATLRLSKSIPGTLRREQLPGSFDPPLICGAGVIARVPGSVRVDATGLGWNDANLYPACPVDGRYAEPQGIALYGRSLFVGVGASVACVEYTPAPV